MSGPIAGIDLGTSNTCIACFWNGRSELIHNRLGARTTPSAVLYSESGDVIVGESALRKAVMYPERTIVGSKRLVGRDFDSPEVRRIAPVFGFEVCAAPNGDAWLRVAGREISPVEVQAHILASVRDSLQGYFAAEVREATITVPASFDEIQRQAVRDAAEIAGLSVRRIISEPTAAALAYGYSQNDKRTVVVFDLGGGTFDITVISIERGRFDVLATDGDMLLGGADFDRALVQRFIEDIRDTHGIDPMRHPMSRQRLVLEAERIKKELSSFQFADSSLQYITDGSAPPINFERRTSRAEFNGLVQPLLEQVAEPCRRALKQAGIRTDQIDEVLAVGGMTRCPAVQDRLFEVLGRRPLMRVNPDEAVALGAAIHTGIMSGELPKKTLIDVAPRSVGLKVSGDRVAQLIARSTPLPATATKRFRAIDDRNVTLEILQGEGESVSSNRRLAWVDLMSFRPKRGLMYEVTLTLTEEGRLSATAKDVDSGTELQVALRPSSGLTRVLIEKLKSQFAERGDHSAVKKSKKITFK